MLPYPLFLQKMSIGGTGEGGVSNKEDRMGACGAKNAQEFYRRRPINKYGRLSRRLHANCFRQEGAEKMCL